MTKYESRRKAIRRKNDKERAEVRKGFLERHGSENCEVISDRTLSIKGVLVELDSVRSKTYYTEGEEREGLVLKVEGYRIPERGIDMRSVSYKADLLWKAMDRVDARVEKIIAEKALVAKLKDEGY
jgi:hypothetical protein